jgi:hypothetical protein
MVSLFGNTLLDITCEQTVNGDLGAINSHGKSHPSLDILASALAWTYIPVTVRRLPRLFPYTLEKCARFFGKGVLHLGPIGPLVAKRLELGGPSGDFGIDFLILLLHITWHD